MFHLRRNQESSTTTIGLAGWLFADLFLGLAMLFLVSYTSGQGAQALFVPTLPVDPAGRGRVTPAGTPTSTFTPRPIATNTATPTITPTPSPVPTKVEALDEQRYTATLRVDASALVETDAAQVRAQADVVQQLTDVFAPHKGRRVAIVLTFGGGRDGTVTASEVNKLLRNLFPDEPQMFERSVTEDFLDLSDSVDTVTIWYWLFTPN